MKLLLNNYTNINNAKFKKMIKILDCTLRDGGYYNNWDFDGALVSNYIKAMIDSKIDIIEIGFRSLLEDLLRHIIRLIIF